jgi:hypothetical protein
VRIIKAAMRLQKRKNRFGGESGTEEEVIAEKEALAEYLRAITEFES